MTVVYFWWGRGHSFEKTEEKEKIGHILAFPLKTFYICNASVRPNGFGVRHIGQCGLGSREGSGLKKKTYSTLSSVLKSGKFENYKKVIHEASTLGILSPRLCCVWFSIVAWADWVLILVVGIPEPERGISRRISPTLFSFLKLKTKFYFQL